jgi:hypothetical protein
MPWGALCDCRWSDDLRFRVGQDETDSLVNVSVRISSGGGLGLGGSEIGFAAVDTKAITLELQKLRQQQRAGKGVGTTVLVVLLSMEVVVPPTLVAPLRHGC